MFCGVSMCKMIQCYSRCMLQRVSPMLQKYFNNAGFTGHICGIHYFFVANVDCFLFFGCHKFLQIHMKMLHGVVAFLEMLQTQEKIMFGIFSQQ